MVSGFRILLGVTGGIAAYKTAELIRLLRQQQCEVQVVMTSAAQQFITKTTLQAVSGKPVRDDLWDQHAEASMGHIELAKWAQAIVIAPASADCLARLAHGMSNDLLTTLCLASTAPLFVAPAMNQAMWRHAATVYNVKTLQARGAHLLGPACGEQACGDVGPGRMLEPHAIAEAIINLQSSSLSLAAKQVLITAGPTHEPIDPVRYLGNRSSGKMGYALAEAALNEGAQVTLISGPTHEPPPSVQKLIRVQTAVQMHQAVMEALEGTDLFFAVAAVADYAPAIVSPRKIKKDGANLTLKLKPTVDIVQWVCRQPKRPFVVAFAAETDDVITHALSKWQRKGCDLLVANDVSSGQIFGQDLTRVTVLSAQGQRHWGPGTKCDCARQLLQWSVQEQRRHADLIS